MAKEELAKEEQEFVQSQQEVEALASGESALVEYIPKSKAQSLETLMPRNMAFEIQKALNAVVMKNGNIDNYVRDHLKYSSIEDLWKGMAAEQVDAVALYLSQFEKEQGIIIGDQTGIGKGRQAAAVIRHAIMNGYLPVFFTRKPDLFTDMYRDLNAIGFRNIHPFLVNTETEARIKDAEGNILFSPLSSEKQYDLLVKEKTVATDSPESIHWHKQMGIPLPDPEKTPTIVLTESISYLPGDYDCIFCTYSQIQAAHPYKRSWLEQLTNAGVEGSRKYKKVVFILDESHMAGGFDSIIGTWMRKVLPKTKSCCYLSATFAKYPEVMPFYAKKTAIQETGLDDEKFVAAMQSGGLALQEIVASNLAESGQLIRRQRSVEGIKVEYIVLDQEPARSKNRDSVNRIIRLMNEVVEFEEVYINPLLGAIHATARQQGEHMEKTPASLGVKQSPYFSRVFNIVDQMLFSLKVEEVAKQTIELLNENKKVVIAFKSTMGSFLKDLNLVSGDSLSSEQLDFASTLVKGLNSVFNYNYTDIAGNKSRMKIELESLPPAGVKKYKEILQAMREEITGLNISPIDQLIHILEHTQKSEKLGGHKGKTFKVAEVTGRSQRLKFEEKEGIVQSFRTDTEKFFRLFNHGDYDVLLINQSGSTGSSAHASKDFKDQRIRAMIIHQFELDINTEIQKRGRINRTGQIVLPEYYYITSDIPAERRLMTMLKAKLKSLDANTTGSQKTSEDTLQSADFMNKYGDTAAWKWVEENPELAERMGWPTYFNITDKNGNTSLKRNFSKEGAIRQVTGRAGLLLVEDQDILYQDLLNRYEAEVQYEKQRGTYDLETEFLRLDAEIKKRFLFSKGKGGKTPFGKNTVREESIVNNLKRPFAKDELDKLLTRVLEGRKPKQVQLEQINKIKENYPSVIEERKAKRMETIHKLKIDLEELPERGSGETQEDNEKIDRQRSRAEELIREKTESLTNYVQQLEQVQAIIIKAIQFWQTGEVVKVPLWGSTFSSWGIFIGLEIGQGKNPYTLANISLRFAVTDSRKLVEYNLTPEQQGMVSSIYTESKDIKEEEITKVNTEWNELVKEASHKREKRHLLTENIVGASYMIGFYNKLIKYNTREGTIKNGILLAREFGNEGEDKQALLPISDALMFIEQLEKDEEFSDHQMRVKFKRISTNYYQVFLHKKGNFTLHTDQTLRSLIKRAEGQSEDELPDFVQNAGDMTGTLHQRNLERFLERLDNFGVQYLGEAKELEDWEMENQEDWNEKTKSKESFRYKLTRPYGQGSNPTIGFTGYEEPNPFYPFGIVLYNRALSDKERYNYSLIPIFANAEEPYRAWKKHIEESILKEEFLRTVEEAKTQPFHQAIQNLAYFITNNPHEDGNPEFVFGEFGGQALGKEAYQDMIGAVTGIDNLMTQLAIELEYL
jgi:hypothetical protein